MTLGGLLSRPARCHPRIADDTPETARHLVGALCHIRRCNQRSSEHPRPLTVVQAAVAGRLRPTLFAPSLPTMGLSSAVVLVVRKTIHQRRRRFLPSTEGRGFRAVKIRSVVREWHRLGGSLNQWKLEAELPLKAASVR